MAQMAWRQQVRACLQDGEAHTLGELVSRVEFLIPPEVARRYRPPAGPIADLAAGLEAGRRKVVYLCLMAYCRSGWTVEEPPRGSSPLARRFRVARRACRQCGAPFLPDDAQQVVCSPACRQDRRRATMARYEARHPRRQHQRRQHGEPAHL